VCEAEMGQGAQWAPALVASKPSVKTAASAFVPMQTPVPNAALDIRIELRRCATAITVSWPTEAAGACAAWMRELLR
jgi:transposase